MRQVIIDTKEDFFLNLFRDQEDANAYIQGNLVRNSIYISDKEEFVGRQFCYTANLIFEYISIIDSVEYHTKLLITGHTPATAIFGLDTLTKTMTSTRLDIEAYITTKLNGITVRPGRLVT